MPPTISDYYRSAIEGARNEILSSSDAAVLGMDRTAWLDYLEAKWGMRAIEFDTSRERRLIEVEQVRQSRHWDINTDHPAGSTFKQTAVQIEFPVVPSDTIDTIWKLGIAPNRFSISHSYPPFSYSEGMFAYAVQPEPSAVNKGIEFVTQQVMSYNSSIQEAHAQFRPELERLVAQKLEEVQKRQNGLDALAVAVGIPLVKKADVSSVVPAAPRVRASLAPLFPPKVNTPTRPVLETAQFNGILELLDNSGRQFERTPQAFQMLAEEGLRDVVLGNLNGLFQGAATGEAFQRVGKVDIHLRIDSGEVFLAEVKFWAGPETLREVVGQLLERLTWRDSYGVAMLFSTNIRFSDVLASVRDTLSSCVGFARQLPATRGENHFVARFSIPSDPSRQATIHVLVYNLFTSEPGKRTAKRRTQPPRA